MNSTIPIIALTADVTTVDVAKCKAIGMNDYIAKLVDEQLLYSKIVAIVKSNSAMQNPEVAETQQSETCIDLGFLTRRTKANPALMAEMINLYLEQTPVLIQEMKQGLAVKDWRSVHSAVHKIIPSFSIMGIHPDFEKMAKTVQEYATTQLQADDIHELIHKLDTVCTKACEELKVILRSLQIKNS